MAIYTTKQTNSGVADFTADDVFTTVAATSGNEAALTNTGTVTITGSTFSDNGMPGLTNSGTATISGATFSGNTAAAGNVLGGGLNNSTGMMYITASIIDNNFSTDGSGMKAESRGTTTIAGSTFSNNKGSSALYITNTNRVPHTVYVDGSLFIGNTTTMSANTYKGGAAIRNEQGSKAFVTNSTFTANRGWYGAIYANGQTNVENCTFTANLSDNIGGDIYITTYGNLTSKNNIFINTNTGGTYGGGVIYADKGKGTSQNDQYIQNYANAEGGAIFLNNGCTSFVVTDGIFTANTATNGGAILNYTLLDVSGSTFTENVSRYTKGGGAIINVGKDISGSYRASTVHVSGSLFDANQTIHSEGQGGALFNQGSTATVSGSTFSNGYTVKNGGAISNEELSGNAAYLSVTGSTFSGNRANVFGGAIYNASTTEITDSIFSGNSANTSGALYNIGTATVTNSQFTENKSSSQGGAINNNANGQIEFDVATFSGNTANFGGALYNKDGQADIANAQFTANSANYGGSVNNSAGLVTIGNATFTDNTATQGGALYNAGTINVSDSLFTGNAATTAGDDINNAADGLVTVDGSTFTGDITTNAITNAGTMTVSESNFTGNTAVSGNVVNNTGTLTVIDSTVTGFFSTSGNIVNNNGGVTTINNSLFTATTTTTGNILKGGRFNVDGSTFTDNTDAHVFEGVTAYVTNSYFSGNSAGTHGNGSVLVGVAGTVSNSVITSNYGRFGGAGYLSGSLTLDANTITDNRSWNIGGFAYLQSGAKITSTNNTFTGNFAPAGDGGGVYFNGSGSLDSTNDYYGYNRTGGRGGVIAHRNANGTATFTGATFTGNSAGQAGGAIYSLSKLTVADASFIANSGYTGGAIYNIGTATVTDSEFTGNTSGLQGGAINNNTAGQIYVTGAVFTSNSAGTAGAFYNADGQADIADSVFLANSATRDGGAVYNASGVVSVSAAFINNIAVNGGAIYNAGTTNVSDSLFAGNTATSGQNIYNAAGGLVTVEESTFTGDIASHAINNAGTVNISESTFTGTTAASGSFILNNTGVANITNSQFTDITNSSVLKGGTINIDGSTFTTKVGGPVLDSATINVTNSYFDGNQSTHGSVLVGVNGTVSNSVITNNRGNWGGVGYISGSLTLNANTISSNNASLLGGVFYVMQNAHIYSTGNVYTENTQGNADGGAVFANAGGGFIDSTNDYFGNNNASGLGGVISYRNANGSFTVTGSTFEANYSNQAGGAIMSAAPRVTIDGAYFKENSSRQGGGAITNGVNGALVGTMSIANSTFTANTANVGGFAERYRFGGGAVYNNGALVNIDNCVFEGNTFGGRVTNLGGAIYNLDASATVSGVATTYYGTATIKDSQFLTFSDYIQTDAGNTTTLQGTITTNASIQGAGTYQADGLSLVFAGDQAITVSNLVEIGDGLTGVTFANTAAVTFTSQDLAGKTITVLCDTSSYIGTMILAKGLISVDSASFTVNGEAATIGVRTANRTQIDFASGDLTLTVFPIEVSANYTLDTALADAAVNPGVIGFAAETDGTTCTFTGNAFDHDQIFEGNGAGLTKIATDDGKMAFANGYDIAMSDLAFESILYGGALDEDTDGTGLDFQDVALGGNVFGGGRATPGLSIDNGDIAMAITDSTQASGKAVYGGAYANGGTATADSVSLTLANVDAGSNSVYGAGAVNNGGAVEVGIVATEISGGVYGAIYNGANIYTAGTGSSFEAGPMSLEISGGTFNGAVGNGSTPRSGATSTQGTSTLAITDGLFQGPVYGGAASFGGNATVASTDVSISGGTFTGKVFGGNVGSTGANATNASLTGNANLTIDSSASDIYFNGNVFGGSMGASVVGGNVNVTFTGVGNKLHFGTNSSISGTSEYAYDNISYVEGTKTLVFDSYTGDFNANIQGPAFDTVTVKNGSLVTFSGAGVRQNVELVSTWNFEVSDANAVMIADDASTTNVKNNFRGDTINITFADGAAIDDTDWTVYQGTDATILGWNKLGGVTIDGVAAVGAKEGSYMAWTTDDYKVYVDENKDIRLAKLA